MELALHTGIAPSVWGDEGSRAIQTALELLANRNDDDDDTPGPGGPQMSG